LSVLPLTSSGQPPPTLLLLLLLLLLLVEVVAGRVGSTTRQVTAPV
jgi:hypothetical protein